MQSSVRLRRRKIWKVNLWIQSFFHFHIFFFFCYIECCWIFYFRFHSIFFFWNLFNLAHALPPTHWFYYAPRVKTNKKWFFNKGIIKIPKNEPLRGTYVNFYHFQAKRHEILKILNLFECWMIIHWMLNLTIFRLKILNLQFLFPLICKQLLLLCE
jgi:hypothetical protein